MIFTKLVALFSIKWNILGYIMLSWAIYFNSTARARGTSAVCEESADSLSKLSKGLYLFHRLLLMCHQWKYLLSKEGQASPPSYCCLHWYLLESWSCPPGAGKNLSFLSVAQEIKAPDIRIAASMCKVSVRINPFLVGLILFKSEQSWTE